MCSLRAIFQLCTILEGVSIYSQIIISNDEHFSIVQIDLFSLNQIYVISYRNRL